MKNIMNNQAFKVNDVIFELDREVFGLNELKKNEKKIKNIVYFIQ